MTDPAEKLDPMSLLFYMSWWARAAAAHPAGSDRLIT